MKSLEKTYTFLTLFTMVGISTVEGFDSSLFFLRRKGSSSFELKGAWNPSHQHLSTLNEVPGSWKGSTPTRRVLFSSSETDEEGKDDNANSQKKEEEVIEDDKDDDTEEDEMTPPGKMKASEIKSELDLRGVSYAGVFERSELEAILIDARLDGIARPEIIENFNEQYNEKQRKKFEDAINKQANETSDIDWENVPTANDGSLPGGMKREDMEKLTQNEELMALLANPKLQNFMSAIMKKDMEKVGEYSKDSDIMEIVTRFQELAQETGFDMSKMG